MKKVKIENENTNVPTAKLRIKLLKYVIKWDYYPKNWFYLNEIEKLFTDDLITGKVYDAAIEKMMLDEDPSSEGLAKGFVLQELTLKVSN